MSDGNFACSLAFVLEFEGGYVDHPSDPGGATNRGVTQRVYDSFRAGLPLRSVRDIEESEIEAIYRDLYWRRTRADILPSGIDFVMFDFAVHSGVGRAARSLQGLFSGLSVDGVIGPKTVQALLSVSSGATIGRLCAMRLGFLRSLGHWSEFGNGWSRRILDERTGVIVRAMEMLDG